MTCRGRRRPAWAACLLAAAVVLTGASPARAGDPIEAGAAFLGVGGAVSISHAAKDGLDPLAGFQLLPHVGYVVTDTMGPGWLRGNLAALIEPTLLHLESDSGSPTVVGASALARWIVAGDGSRVRPYVEVGAGVLTGEMRLPQTNCSVSFLVQAGPGVLVVLSDTITLTVGYRFQHISNASLCDVNAGINSSALYLGVSRRFR